MSARAEKMPRKKKIETGDAFLDKFLNATQKELHEMVKQLADKMIEEEGGKEGLERLAKRVLEGKVRFGVLDGAAIDAALKKVGSEVDILQKTVSIVKCPNCGKKTLYRERSPPWTWQCLAGRGSDECRSCGYKASVIS